MKTISPAQSLAGAKWLTLLPGILSAVLLTASVLCAAAAPPAQPAVIQFASANYFVSETGVVVTIFVNRTGDATVEASVDYSTDCGTAISGLDYESQTGTLLFAPGQDSRTFDVPIIDRGWEDGARAVLLSLSNPSGAEFGTQTNATLTILDDELQQVLSSGLDKWTLSHCGGPAGLRIAYAGKFVALSYDGFATCSSDGRAWSAYSAVPGYGLKRGDLRRWSLRGSGRSRPRAGRR